MLIVTQILAMIIAIHLICLSPFLCIGKLVAVKAKKYRLNH